MQKINIIFILFLFLFSNNLFSQDGSLRGTVTEEATSATIPSVKITIKELNLIARTDLDGQFNFNLPAGVYTVQFEASEMELLVMESVQIKAGEITVLDDVKIKEKTISRTNEEVTIKAEKVKNSEKQILDLKLKSTNLIDGISAKELKKTGDGDLAAAAKRVPGISVVGGKYIYVRGLGDRYNKTLLNGVDIPGLDPDRNTLQMDIFPTSVIDNLVIHKSFVAELPADFSGGVIDISLKSFSNSRVRNISVSGSYNPAFHFNSNYLDYQGGKTDFLGFDDGTRDIPAVNNLPFYSDVVGKPNGASAQRYIDILKSFNPTMAALRQQSFMDYSIGSSFANQFKKDKVTLGYNLVLNYKNTTEYYSEIEYGKYGLLANPDIEELEVREKQTGDLGINNILLSGLAGFSLKTLKSKYTLNVLHLQNGESKAGIFDFTKTDQGATFTGYQHNLEYSEKSLTNLLISGHHQFEEKDWDVEWKISPTFSKISDPDIRFTRYENREGGLVISSEAGFPERIWRDLSERNLVGVTHFTKKFHLFDQKAKLKFGTSYIYKERDFDIRKFMINVRNVPLTGNPDELFAPENIWPISGEVTDGTTYEANFAPTNPNKFNSSIRNIAGYVSAELKPFNRFETTIGVRMEYYTHRYTGQDQLGTNVLENDKVLEDLGFFPSFNATYKITEKQNLRFSYGNTIARPSFKELSYAEISDPLTGRTFIGGLFRDANDGAGIVYWDGKLTATNIHNLDARWEIFTKSAQTISVSTFYKKFIRPIEIVQYTAQAGSFQPRNVGDGDVLGAEFEIRQDLDIISKKLKAFSISFNYTYVQSQIELSKTEFDSRVANARTGQTIKPYRDMAGQAPYIINGGLAFKGLEEGFWKHFDIGLYYNVQGQTLLYTGIVDRPDIYTNPFHSLNLNASKSFGKDKKMNVGFKAENILNSRLESVYKSYGAQDQFFTKMKVGRSFQASFTYNF